MGNELSVIRKTYDLVLWAIPHIRKFPKEHRFLLDEFMGKNLYSVPED